MQLTDYEQMTVLITPLDLPFSASQLHGMLCAYLVTGATDAADSFLTALSINSQRSDETRAASLALFNLFALTQNVLSELGFDFQLVLPNQDQPLAKRAQAFSEWCEGFTQALSACNVRPKQLKNPESREALEHLAEFAELDCEMLEVNEDDEQALMEVSEYTRIAVLHLHSELTKQPLKNKPTSAAH